MNLTNMGFHGVTQVEIRPESGASFEWVKLVLLDRNGNETEISLHFDQDHQREMFLEQIGQKVLA